MNKVWIVQRHIWIYLQHTRVKLIFQSMSWDANKEENLLAVLNFIQWKIKLLFMKSPGIKFAQYSFQNFKSYCSGYFRWLPSRINCLVFINLKIRDSFEICLSCSSFFLFLSFKMAFLLSHNLFWIQYPFWQFKIVQYEDPNKEY